MRNGQTRVSPTNQVCKIEVIQLKETVPRDKKREGEKERQRHDEDRSKRARERHSIEQKININTMKLRHREEC